MQLTVFQIGLKLIRKFGSSTAFQCKTRLLESLQDPKAFCRKHALRAIEVVIAKSKKYVREEEGGRREAGRG
jgi:hypothetical protein